LNKREAIRLAKKIDRFEKDGPDVNAGVNECVKCGEHYHVQVGLDPSALCHPCAQTAAVAFAAILALRKAGVP
jgi:hypothetical protein